MRVAITGVNGFIGTHLAESLRSKGEMVVGMGRHIKYQGDADIEYVSGDITDAEVTRRFIKNADIVFHLAAITAHEAVVARPKEAMYVSLMGLWNVLEAIQYSKKPVTVVFASSGKVYGKSSELPIFEEYPTSPANIIGRIKKATECLLEFYSSLNSQHTFVAARVFNVYGPGQSEQFLIPTILRQLHERSEKKITVSLGDVNARRDYLYVGDVTEALVRLGSYRCKNKVEYFNVCSGQSKSALEILEIIAKTFGGIIEIETDRTKLRPEEWPDEFGSFHKMERLTGWRPRISMVEGIEATVRDWYDNNSPGRR